MKFKFNQSRHISSPTLIRKFHRLLRLTISTSPLFLTVNPWAINSSGTSSGRKTGGVIHGKFWFNGNSVTITSPFAKPSRTRPVDNSIVRIWPISTWLLCCPLGPRMATGGISITAAGDTLLGCDVTGNLLPLFLVLPFPTPPGLELDGGGGWRTEVLLLLLCVLRFSWRFTCVVSVSRTAGLDGGEGVEVVVVVVGASWVGGIVVTTAMVWKGR